MPSFHMVIITRLFFQERDTHTQRHRDTTILVFTVKTLVMIAVIAKVHTYIATKIHDIDSYVHTLICACTYIA